MQTLLAISKALSDEARLRLLLALRDGELCVCQIVELLGLAPSTVSRHLELLHHAGLVQRRKDGRWHYYRLPGAEAPAAAHQAVRWVLAHGPHASVAVTDARKLCAIRDTTPQELTACRRHATR